MIHPSYSVLIVDDTPEDRMMYRRFLAHDPDASYTFREAGSADEGLALCREQAPDIVLIDFILPDEDGLNLLESLLAEFGSARFAILMLTGTGSEDVAVEAMKRGAHDYMVKSVALEQRLIIAIHSALGKVALEQKIEQQRLDLEASNQRLQDALGAQQASADQLRLALRAAQMVTWEWDIPSRSLQWSAGFEERVGVSPDVLGGDFERFFGLLAPEYRELTQQRLEQAIVSGTLDEIEFRVHAPDGGIIWMSASGYLQHDAQGAPKRLIGIVMDITARKQAELELRQREHEYKMLVENAPDIIARFNSDLQHIYVSPTVSRATGMPKEAFLGKTNRELGMPDAQCDLWDVNLSAVFATGQPRRMEFDFQTPEGLHYYQATIVPERSADGTIETVMSVARDITDYKTVERHLRFLADSSVGLAGSLDPLAMLTHVAKSAIAYYGEACTIDLADQNEIRAVAIAHHDPNIVAAFTEMRQRYPVRAESSHPVAQVLKHGQTLVVDTIPQHIFTDNTYDSEHVRMLHALQPASFLMVPLIVRGRAVGVIGLYALGTPRHYSHDDLTTLEELSRRVALALDNAQLYQEAQEALREREAFISIASHEIKNPLTSLLGRAQMLQRRLARLPDPGRAQDDAEIIVSQGMRINSLLTDLLDVSRLASEQLTITRKRLELTELVRNAVANLQASSPNYRIALTAEDSPLWLEGDAGRIDQMLLNLLGNAIKYSPECGIVYVDVRAVQNTAQIAIRDEGVGIPADALPHLFKRFYRVSRASVQQVSGSGIGLYVVNQIVQGHGGTISVASTEGVGSTFTVQIPLTQ
ncbi:hypothetical protein SE17_07920 [Kouleothrix aurantiaca]|uniref:histidine kinase n=1 Tax=Kouleothrix aurantiaca TaxID=186479 RepID=A0A0P9HG25_9CHLR|nr:hypothetical protein SE17_07920 [Kouleothrix aurantiaca]